MGKEIKELECVFGYIGHRRRRQTSVNLQIHWHDTDSDYQMCCPQLSAIHGKDCRRTCVGRNRYGVESCAVTKRRSKLPIHFYSPLLLKATIKSHQTRCGGISQRKKHLLEQDVSCSSKTTEQIHYLLMPCL